MMRTAPLGSGRYSVSPRTFSAARAMNDRVRDFTHDQWVFPLSARTTGLLRPAILA